jgi:hypothetical protein
MSKEESVLQALGQTFSVYHQLYRAALPDEAFSIARFAIWLVQNHPHAAASIIATIYQEMVAS